MQDDGLCEAGDVKGGQKVQRVALQKCGTQWLVDTVIVGRRPGCM
jgi:hypothetical protein